MVHRKYSFRFLRVMANTSLGERITLNYFWKCFFSGGTFVGRCFIFCTFV